MSKAEKWIHCQVVVRNSNTEVHTQCVALEMNIKMIPLLSGKITYKNTINEKNIQWDSLNICYS